MKRPIRSSSITSSVLGVSAQLKCTSGCLQQTKNLDIFLLRLPGCGGSVKKRKAEAAISTHAEAASKHASSTLAFTELQVIAQAAKDLGFTIIRLQGLIMAHTLESLVGKQKQRSEDENHEDDMKMSAEETRGSGEEIVTTMQTVGSVANDVLHFASCAMSDSQNKFTQEKLTEIFTPSMAVSSTKTRACDPS